MYLVFFLLNSQTWSSRNKTKQKTHQDIFILLSEHCPEITFQKVCSNLKFHHECCKAPVSEHTHQHSVLIFSPLSALAMTVRNGTR